MVMYMGWVKSLTSLHGRNCHFIFIYSTRGLQFISVQTACDIFGKTNLHLSDIFIARRNCIASVCIIHTWSKGIAKQLCCLQVYLNVMPHSALFGGLRFTQFWTSMCGIPNYSGWSPRPDFDGLDQFHHWTLRKSQGEAGQGGAHLEGPRCLLSVPEGGVTGKNFFSKIHSKFY